MEVKRAQVSRGGGSGHLGQVPPAGQEDLATWRSWCPLQKVMGLQEKPMWRGELGEGPGKMCREERGLEVSGLKNKRAERLPWWSSG